MRSSIFLLQRLFWYGHKGTPHSRPQSLSSRRKIRRSRLSYSRLVAAIYLYSSTRVWKVQHYSISEDLIPRYLCDISCLEIERKIKVWSAIPQDCETKSFWGQECHKILVIWSIMGLPLSYWGVGGSRHKLSKTSIDSIKAAQLTDYLISPHLTQSRDLSGFNQINRPVSRNEVGRMPPCQQASWSPSYCQFQKSRFSLLLT